MSDHKAHTSYDRRCKECIIEFREAGIAAHDERPELWNIKHNYYGWASAPYTGPDHGWPNVEGKISREALEKQIDKLRQEWEKSHAHYERAKTRFEKERAEAQLEKEQTP